MLVAGVGTGGTITGVGQVMKERRPETLGGRGRARRPRRCSPAPGPHKIQGIGAGFVPEVLDRDLIDEVIPVDDETALERRRDAARREGLLVGISAGAALTPRSRSLRGRGATGKRIVTIAADGGERYMSLPFFLSD